MDKKKEILVSLTEDQRNLIFTALHSFLYNASMFGPFMATPVEVVIIHEVENIAKRFGCDYQKSISLRPSYFRLPKIADTRSYLEEENNEQLSTTES